MAYKLSNLLINDNEYTKYNLNKVLYVLNTF